MTSDIPTPGFWEGTPDHLSGGLEYELARDLAERFGLKSVRVEIQDFDRVVAGQLDGADLALDLITPTSQRERSLTFSSPYLNAPPTVVVRTGTEVPDLATAQTLRWGAVRGTTFVGTIEDLIAPHRQTQMFGDSTQLLVGLQQRKVDAVLLDMPLAVVTANRSDGHLRAVAQLPGSETIAAALPKHTGNQEAVDSALRAFTADGTIDDLLRVWVGSSAAEAEKSIPLIRTTR